MMCYKSNLEAFIKLLQNEIINEVFRRSDIDVDELN